MKKKAWFFVLAGVLALSLGATAAMAAGRGQAAQGQNYVDRNGDGICDNGGAGQYYIDADGDRACDHCQGQGVCVNNGTCVMGQNYVDADGDGVCDNQGTQAKAWQGGHHQNGGHHRNCR